MKLYVGLEDDLEEVLTDHKRCERAESGLIWVIDDMILQKLYRSKEIIQAQLHEILYRCFYPYIELKTAVLFAPQLSANVLT